MSAGKISRRSVLKLIGVGGVGAGHAFLKRKGLTIEPEKRVQNDSELIHTMSAPRTGDVHPYFHDGVCYLYYLIPDTYQSKLVRSADLLKWEEVPVVETDPSNPDSAPYFVLDVFEDMLNGVFRTYHGWSGNRMISHTSPDLLTWTIAPPEFSIPSQMTFSQQRDPYVFWNEDEAAYWCLMTCKVSGAIERSNGAVGFASSPDLQHWTGRGKLFYPGNIDVPECPQQFKIGDKWYLLASVFDKTVGKPSYWISDAPTGPWAAPQPDSLDGAHNKAANAAFDGDRLILIGWIPLDETTWGGHIAFPREIYALADGRLGARLEAGVAAAVRGTALFPQSGAALTATKPAGWTIDGQSARFDGSASDGEVEISGLPADASRFDAEFDIQLGSARSGGLRLNANDTTGAVDILLDQWDYKLYVKDSGGADYASFGPIPAAWFAEPHHCRVIAEGNIVELFVDDVYALAARTTHVLRPGTSVSLFAHLGAAAFEGIGVYKLKTRAELGLA